MADKPIITIDTVAGGFRKLQKQFIVVYRKRMLQELADYFDRMRRLSADAYIIKNISGSRDPYIASKRQKSNPTRLTERTGLLIKMLKNKSSPIGKNWKIGNKLGSIRTSAFIGQVKVNEGFKTNLESYQGTLKVSVTESSSETLLSSSFVQTALKMKSKKRTDMFGNTFNTKGAAAKTARGSLYFRFQHEIGLKGRKRPFLMPAALATHISTQKIIQQKMDSLRSIL